MTQLLPCLTFLFPGCSPTQSRNGFHVNETGYQDEKGEFQQLPFELAHGIARAVTQACFDFQNARKEYRVLKEEDPTEMKNKTIKAKENLEKLKSPDLYLVFNRKTGHMATAEWMKRNMLPGPDGVPRPRKENSTAKPWITCVQFRVLQAEKDFSVALKFQVSEGSPFRRVRLFCFENGSSSMKVAMMTAGYQHLLQQDDEDRQTWKSRAGYTIRSDIVFHRHSRRFALSTTDTHAWPTVTTTVRHYRSDCCLISQLSGG